MAAEEAWVCGWAGSGRPCGQRRVMGEERCVGHLEGPSAEGLRRCGYVANRNSRQCGALVGKAAGGKEGLCPAHAHLVTQVRRRAARKTQLRETPEVIAENLAHYSAWAAGHSTLPKPDSISSIQAQNKTRLHRPRLDYFSDASDDSGDEAVANHRLNPPPLPAPSHPDDPLRHAGVFTAEEVLRISRDKLLHLQGLYKDYLGVLGQKLRLSMQRERVRGREGEGWVEGDRASGTGSSAWAVARERERRTALRRYGRVSKAEGLVERRGRRERRLAAGLGVSAEQRRETCEEEGCADSALPSAAFCLRHVLRQDGQLLFAECLTPECTTPVPPFASLRHCWLHRPIPTTLPWLSAHSALSSAASSSSTLIAPSPSPLFPTGPLSQPSVCPAQGQPAPQPLPSPGALSSAPILSPSGLHQTGPFHNTVPQKRKHSSSLEDGLDEKKVSRIA